MMKDIAIALSIGSGVTAVLALAHGQRGRMEAAHVVFGALATLATLAARQSVKGR
jgi:hypothetical protein